VFVRSGCLACHQLGARGASGPGTNLAGVGARLSRTAILRALVDAPAPMPSYRKLAAARLDDLIAYLTTLRDGMSCPGESDCG
jgi:mono/diheme cytochrome c family protein